MPRCRHGGLGSRPEAETCQGRNSARPKQTKSVSGALGRRSDSQRNDGRRTGGRATCNVERCRRRVKADGQRRWCGGRADVQSYPQSGSRARERGIGRDMLAVVDVRRRHGGPCSRHQTERRSGKPVSRMGVRGIGDRTDNRADHWAHGIGRQERRQEQSAHKASITLLGSRSTALL